MLYCSACNNGTYVTNYRSINVIGSSGGSCAGSFTFLDGADIDEVCYASIMTSNVQQYPQHTTWVSQSYHIISMQHLSLTCQIISHNMLRNYPHKTSLMVSGCGVHQRLRSEGSERQSQGLVCHSELRAGRNSDLHD